jgi:hypothetical protein
VAKAGLDLENCIEAGSSEDTQVNSSGEAHDDTRTARGTRWWSDQ